MKGIKLFLFILLIGSCFITGIQAKKRKTVFIIADGIPADVIERVQTPVVDEIATAGAYRRAYMGGEVGGPTQTPTVSAVCYNSLLTSTWANKHNVWDNSVDNPNYNYWSIFRIAESQKKDVKTAIFSSWLDNRTKLVGESKAATGNLKIDYVLDGLELDTKTYPEESHSLQIHKIDEKISEEAANCIKKDAPDVMWVYLWFMDCAGHEFGDSPFFDNYTELTDKQIGRIWEAVKYREKAFDEEWMIVVTTDHGRNAIDGKGHGGQTQRERTTWIATNVKPNDYFKNNQPGIVDIVPSICRFMNFSIPRDVQFEQEGTPFIGKIDISNVKAEKKDNQIVITWNNYDNSPVEIYLSTTNNFKEGKADEWIKVGKAKANQKRFVFDSSGINTPLCKFSVRSKNNMLPVWVNLKETR